MLEKLENKITQKILPQKKSLPKNKKIRILNRK